MPADDPIPQPDPEPDDKLYCVCSTPYDEDRVMIACDRCDEWYHTQCVHISDLQLDLVDQFICPPCVQKHPHLALATTWKPRCFRGQRDTHPDAPQACHKPARGAFSKYCSDACGIAYMQARIDACPAPRAVLWEQVKDAEKREGVVVPASPDVAAPVRTGAVQREVARLNARLEQVVQEREAMKRVRERVVAREKLVRLAVGRAERVDQCGWDQRMCLGEDEWADVDVFEGYAEERSEGEGDEDQEAMQVDTDADTPGEWWCTGKKKCERHSGWQKLRAAEVEYDKELKDAALLRLTTREREVRKSIEDILFPQASVANVVPVANVAVVPDQPQPLATRLNGNGVHDAKGKKKKRS
ncbi:hypothetical protein BJ138DRAFT_1053987 [Hygrophoropsis aurantiaca]|uniref:Uncharacterized protein n=1 Tax=Hygrophoropsis aurantiaca TaxID=72124 RepID=A0ACB8ARF7_9AGAM|nr:hypothetical protein BJ138DRAFT_1053987 [Hygrophoropsis aurantiaca]